MKAAAEQAGIDPALLERAARLVTSDATLRPSVLERVLGGRTRHTGEAHFPIALDEPGVVRLMSAIRIGVGEPGEGHASALGLTWRSSDDGGAVLSLTAQVDGGSTSVSAEIDRRGTLAVVGGVTAVASVMAFLFGGTVVGELAPGFGAIGAGLGVATVLAAARRYWVSSTRSARDRLGQVLDSVSRFLAQPVASSSDGAQESRARTESNATRDAS